MAAVAVNGDADAVRSHLRRIVPTYHIPAPAPLPEPVPRADVPAPRPIAERELLAHAPFVDLRASIGRRTGSTTPSSRPVR
jgi:hypothetical protein